MHACTTILPLYIYTAVHSDDQVVCAKPMQPEPVNSIPRQDIKPHQEQDDVQAATG